MSDSEAGLGEDGKKRENIIHKLEKWQNEWQYFKCPKCDNNLFKCYAENSFRYLVLKCAVCKFELRLYPEMDLMDLEGKIYRKI